MEHGFSCVGKSFRDLSRGKGCGMRTSIVNAFLLGAYKETNYWLIRPGIENLCFVAIGWNRIIKIQ